MSLHTRKTRRTLAMARAPPPRSSFARNVAAGGKRSALTTHSTSLLASSQSRSAQIVFLNQPWASRLSVFTFLPYSSQSQTLDPGIKFETMERIVVLQRMKGQLRYFASGWGKQENVDKVPNEFGVFLNVDDALPFTQRFLLEKLAPRNIDTPRQVKGGTESPLPIR